MYTVKLNIGKMHRRNNFDHNAFWFHSLHVHKGWLSVSIHFYEYIRYIWCFFRFIRKNLCKYAHACMTNPTVSSVSCSFIHKKPCKYAHACRFIHKRTCINQCFINKLYVKIQVNMRMTCFCDLHAKTYVNMHTHA